MTRAYRHRITRVYRYSGGKCCPNENHIELVGRTAMVLLRAQYRRMRRDGATSYAARAAIYDTLFAAALGEPKFVPGGRS